MLFCYAAEDNAYYLHKYKQWGALLIQTAENTLQNIYWKKQNKIRMLLNMVMLLHLQQGTVSVNRADSQKNCVHAAKCVAGTDASENLFSDLCNCEDQQTA